MLISNLRSNCSCRDTVSSGATAEGGGGGSACCWTHQPIRQQREMGQIVLGVRGSFTLQIWTWCTLRFPQVCTSVKAVSLQYGQEGSLSQNQESKGNVNIVCVPWAKDNTPFIFFFPFQLQASCFVFMLYHRKSNKPNIFTLIAKISLSILTVQWSKYHVAYDSC